MIFIYFSLMDVNSFFDTSVIKIVMFNIYIELSLMIIAYKIYKSTLSCSCKTKT